MKSWDVTKWRHVMIKTVADFLNHLREKENEALKKQDIKHPPTIGDMYEGLTKQILIKQCQWNQT